METGIFNRVRMFFFWTDCLAASAWASTRRACKTVRVFQHDGVHIQIEEAGEIIQHTTGLHRRRQFRELTRFKVFEVLPTDADMLLDFIQVDTEDLPSLIKFCSDGIEDYLGGE